MVMRDHTIYACFFILLLISCTSGSEKASNSVKTFASGLAENDSASVVSVYPETQHFYSLLPKISEVEITEVQKKDSCFIVKCQSSFYDDKSTFVQKNFQFWVINDGGKYLIRDSKGLIDLPTELDHYPYDIGALKQDYKDVELGSNLSDIMMCFYTDCLSHSWRLNNGIKKLSWSWEADWGTPNGKCTIKNELPFEVKDVKYRITYYNGDEVVGSDDGTAAYSIESGAMKSFTFYSSGVNGYRARTAQIEFEVPEKYAIQWTLEESHNGTEFAEFKRTRNAISS